ncbi:SDR family oxidoreductase [Aeoliella mucimassa]|uniref:UDP-glucose 4-epimerase n=1 Tax=Aeoliella mucimassa TaxID=2527972 RepID=A0A518ALV5_9BACT|nr:SDR family oxidoreductase [Aeoliella mucimassa]QDU55688.1 UDP-glucose 4-epimerase [Aeoliella mucimassa]
MTKYLVTGGAGFIGSHITSALVSQGNAVTVFDDFSTGKIQNLEHMEGKIEVARGSLLDKPLLRNAMQGADVVYHQAALASVPRSVANPSATHEACATGTLYVLEVAKELGIRRVIYAGSSSAYGNQPFASKRESDLPSPLSPYAVAKLCGEYYLRAFTNTYGLETVGIRYFNVFGPRQDPDSEYSAVIPKFVTAMLRGKAPTIYGDGLQSRDFTYIDNVVKANLAAASAKDASGKVMNVACGQQATLLDLVDVINKVLGTTIEPTFAEARAGDVRESLADITLARSILGYEPVVTFEEGLRRSIEYYRTLIA